MIKTTILKIKLLRKYHKDALFQVEMTLFLSLYWKRKIFYGHEKLESRHSRKKGIPLKRDIWSFWHDHISVTECKYILYENVPLITYSAF